MTRHQLAAVLVLFVLARAAHGATINVPVDEPTIQAGIDAATAGDTVLVAPGTYSPSTNGEGFPIQMRDAVALVSESGAAATIIDAERRDRVMDCVALTEQTVVAGFTLTRGFATAEQYGGGVHCGGSSPVFEECVFLDNACGSWGGGMSCDYGSSPLVVDCVFAWNFATHGGGMYCDHASGPVVKRCAFIANSALSGGGMHNSIEASPYVVNSTFYGNSADNATLVCGSGSDVALENVIIAFNVSGLAVDCLSGGTATLVCSDVFGNAEGDWVGCISGQAGVNGNIAMDPLFCGPEQGDFTIDAGLSVCPVEQRLRGAHRSLRRRLRLGRGRADKLGRHQGDVSVNLTVCGQHQ